MNTRAVRFPLVDSVRGIACLWVMLYHAAFVTGFIHGGAVVRPWLAQAGTAAMTFFLVSSFLLYRPFAKANIHGERALGSLTFWWRRILRIVPAYWVALTVITLVVGKTVAASTDVFSAHGVLAYYGFGQIYDLGTAQGGIPQAWTLCVEVSFYALLPLWALCMRLMARDGKRNRLHLELASACVLAVAGFGYKLWLITQVDPASFDGSLRFFPLPNYLDAFGIGMAIAVVSVWDEPPALVERAVAWIRRRPGTLWVGAAVLLFAAGPLIGWSGDSNDKIGRVAYMARWELQVAAGTLILLPAIFGGPRVGAVGRLLSSRALLWAGLVSYGFYLYHYALLDLIHRWLGDAMPVTVRFLVYASLAAVLGMAIAAVSYYALERPFLRLKNLFGRAPKSARGEAVAEPAPAEAPRPR